MGSLFPGEDPPPPSSTSVDGARVSGGDGDASGLGPFVMAAQTLAGDSVVGADEKLFAIPWSALTLEAARKCFVLEVSKERLEAAPGFDRDHWLSMADGRWAREVHEYLGAPPYWQAEQRLQ